MSDDDQPIKWCTECGQWTAVAADGSCERGGHPASSLMDGRSAEQPAPIEPPAAPAAPKISEEPTPGGYCGVLAAAPVTVVGAYIIARLLDMMWIFWVGLVLVVVALVLYAVSIVRRARK